jgi:YfiH family protein
MTFENSESARIDFSIDVPYLTFPVLSKIPFLRHGFSTRLGGVSSGIFSSMNFGYDSGPYRDDPANIQENFRRMAGSIGVDPSSFVISRQVHKTNIRIVDENDRGKGLYRPTDYEEIDGLITNKPNITLVTKYADCVPLYFVDLKNRAIGLTHSGWRGTVKKIGKITVEAMQKSFGSDPKELIAVVGPSICAECYEIGEEVADEFRKAFPEDYRKGILTSKENGKYQCDLWAANRTVLTEAGLSPENIHVSGVCTCCNSDLLFSHRKSQGQRGSLAAFLAIADE